MFSLFRSRPSAPPSVTDAELLDALAAADAAALEDADAAFTPARADAQRAAILARLAASDDPRVLSFPPREADAARVRRVHTPRPALGWMLTAAAAGLIVGVGTGHGIYGAWPGEPVPQQVVVATTPRTAAPPVADPDDEILGEVETALAGRGVDALQPLDRLTPTAITLVASR